MKKEKARTTSVLTYQTLTPLMPLSLLKEKVRPVPCLYPFILWYSHGHYRKEILFRTHAARKPSLPNVIFASASISEDGKQRWVDDRICTNLVKEQSVSCDPNYGSIGDDVQIDFDSMPEIQNQVWKDIQKTARFIMKDGTHSSLLFSLSSIISSKGLNREFRTGLFIL